MRRKVKRSDIRHYASCTACGTIDIGDVWICPNCNATRGFYRTWLGTAEFATGHPDKYEDFDKYFELIEE